MLLFFKSISNSVLAKLEVFEELEAVEIVICLFIYLMNVDSELSYSLISDLECENAWRKEEEAFWKTLFVFLLVEFTYWWSYPNWAKRVLESGSL